MRIVQVPVSVYGSSSERPYQGAQLRLTDADGMRLACFATNTAGTPIAHLFLATRIRIL